MRRTFERVMTVCGVSRDVLWDLAHDPEALASCSSHVESVCVEVAQQCWSATLTARVARFAMSAPIQVRIVEEEKLKRVVVRVLGEDRLLGTRLGVDAIGELDANADALGIRFYGAYEVTGRVANLGAPMVSKVADDMINEFWTNIGAVVSAIGATHVAIQ